MGKRFSYESEGEKLSISAGWWLVIMSAVFYWLWKSQSAAGLASILRHLP